MGESNKERSLEEMYELLEHGRSVDPENEETPEFIHYTTDAQEIVEEGRQHQGRPLGFPVLDGITGGVSSGELIIVTAPTGVGKTTLTQSISWMLAKKNNPSLWYTLELNIFQFIQPFLKHDPEVEWDDSGKLLKVSNLPIYFPKNVENLDFKKLKRAIRYANKHMGVEHVFIDHLHYLLDHKSIEKTKSISLHIGERLRSLRKIALETGVSIFLVAHLSKTEDGKRPTLSDMRDSSFIAQEADLVLVLWRERLKHPQMTTVDGVEFELTHSPIVHCAVEKSRRTGRRGMTYFSWKDGLYSEATRQDVDKVEFFDTPKT